jgi:uncharacterized repeat protein (TIGR01451 family)
MTTTFTTYNFSLSVPADVNILSGRDLRFRVVNNSTSNNRRIRIQSSSTSESKYVAEVTPVINIESIKTFDAAYPGGTAVSTFSPGQTVYVVAEVSDPFGSADITGGSITISDPVAGNVVSNQAMTSVATTASTRLYEYSYTVPAGGNPGNWGITIVVSEGSEGTITDTALGGFVLNAVELIIEKSNTLISDPVNGISSPKRIPGAVVRYNLAVSNETLGSPSSNSVSITDALPTQTTLCVSSVCNGGSAPVAFVDGAPSSGLGFSFPSGVSYSSAVGGGAPYNHPPNPGPDGYDLSITGIKLDFTGTMAASTGSAPHPSFQVQIITKIK